MDVHSGQFGWPSFSLANYCFKTLKLLSAAAVFPDLTVRHGEYSVIATDRNDGQTYKSKTRVVITWI